MAPRLWRVREPCRKIKEISSSDQNQLNLFVFFYEGESISKFIILYKFIKKSMNRLSHLFVPWMTMELLIFTACFSPQGNQNYNFQNYLQDGNDIPHKWSLICSGNNLNNINRDRQYKKYVELHYYGWVRKLNYTGRNVWIPDKVSPHRPPDCSHFYQCTRSVPPSKLASTVTLSTTARIYASGGNIW